MDPASQCSMNHINHMDNFKWSGGISYGFMTANGISFGSDLPTTDKCQTFSQLLSKIWHALASMGHQDPASQCSMNHMNHTEDIQ
jgi:3-phosphoglycerate kinase